MVIIADYNPLAGFGSEPSPPTKLVLEFYSDVRSVNKPAGTLRVDVKKPDKNGQQTVRFRGTGIGRSFDILGTVGQETDLGWGRRAIVDIFDDPSFWDKDILTSHFAGPGNQDSWAGFNVNRLVVEVPMDTFEQPPFGGVVGVSASTGRDRVGMPFLEHWLIPFAEREIFGKTPVKKQRPLFMQTVQQGLESFGVDPNDAAATADHTFPDLLTFDVREHAGFPNGRGLEDDVVENELELLDLTGILPGDSVDANDVSFRDAFPYLAPPHEPLRDPGSVCLNLDGDGFADPENPRGCFWPPGPRGLR